MGFAEAEQTDKAVSIASDISWTYSLDLVDSLKLAGSFPQSFFKNAFRRARTKKESDGSRRNCDSVTVKMKVWYTS